jgi:S1-C subfamily serine protease
MGLQEHKWRLEVMHSYLYLQGVCRLIWSFGLLITFFSGHIIAQDYETTLKGIREKSAGSIVHIHSRRIRKDGSGNPDDSYGTGFLVTREGHVITASHVVLKPDGDTIVETTASIRSRHGQRYKLEPIKTDNEIDLMLLALPNDVGIEWKPLTFGDSQTTPTDAYLFALGFPGTSDLTSAEGILSNKSTPHGTWQTTLPLNRGNSGGPVFDKKGRVVAIAKAGNDMQNSVTFVIPAFYVSYVLPNPARLTVYTQNNAPQIDHNRSSVNPDKLRQASSIEFEGPIRLRYGSDFYLGHAFTLTTLRDQWVLLKGRYNELKGYWIFQPHQRKAWQANNAKGPLKYWNEDGQAKGNPEDWELFLFEIEDEARGTVRVKNIYNNYIRLVDGIFQANGNNANATVFTIEF